jgi:tRNA 2-thiouridine synthesizing protein A
VTAVVDARDMLCPIPVLKARKALKQAEPGAVVELLATDPKARTDVPAFCAATGHRLLSADEEGAEAPGAAPVVRYRIEKAAAAG